MARTAAIRVPHALVAEIDLATDDFVVLFDDLGPARAVDQLDGCTLADAETALHEAAALHAPRWGDPALATIDWLAVKPAQLTPMVDAVLPPIITMFKDRYRDVLEPEFVALIDRLPHALIVSRTDAAMPRTVMHGDFRLDNMLFDVNGGAAPIATMDWQTVTIGCGLTDVAYFLSAGISPDERRAHEAALVRGYHAELVRRGVRDYDWDRCWFDYRRNTLHGILMGVFSSMSVERTERGDRQFLKMTRGACEQALDLGSFNLWDA